MSTTIDAPGQLLSPQAAEYEAMYAEAFATGDRTRIPWEDGRASDALVNWLNAVAPSIVRCGARVIVPGCGLGDDARALIQRGYEVLAFDASETAVQWAQQLDPANAHCYCVADLFDPPARWRHRFDLVVEINTVQSLPPETRADTLRALRELMSPHGRMLVICRGYEDGDDDPDWAKDGPPWPLREHELLEAASEAGLEPDGAVSNFVEETGERPKRRLRVLFRRA